MSFRLPIGFFLKLCRDLYRVFTHRERKLAWAVIAMFFVTSLIETLAIGMIFLYFRMIFTPDIIAQNEWLTLAYNFSGATDTPQFLALFGAAVFGVILLKTLFSCTCAWGSIHFATGRMTRFSVDLYRHYLQRPYLQHVSQHTAALKQNVLDEVFQTAVNVILPVCGVIAESLYLIVIAGALLWFKPFETLCILGFCCASFGTYIMLVRRRLEGAGKQRNTENASRFKLANDGFSMFKELSVFGAQPLFIQQFASSAKGFSDAWATQYTLYQYPRTLIELLAFSILFGFIGYYVFYSAHPLEVIPTLALYGAAGLRLMPSFNRIAVYFSNIRFSKQSFYSFADDLQPQGHVSAAPSPAPIAFQQSITLDDVSFRYPAAERDALSAISLTINKGQRVALVGATGSGKTTLADLLLGLMPPTSGVVQIDKQELTADHLASWRQHIGYVPQRVMLMDGTIAQNIALSVDAENIDMQRVQYACRAAKIDEFITTQLPQGYDSPVGEQGVRLSGGQAQRLSIARALYKTPSLLVLDEATAALDGTTEREISEMIAALSDDITIVIIAHRLSTIEHCDCIYLLDHGAIIAQGSYAELVETSPVFRGMAGAGGAEDGIIKNA